MHCEQERFPAVCSLELLLVGVLLWRADTRLHGVTAEFVLEESWFSFGVQCSVLLNHQKFSTTLLVQLKATSLLGISYFKAFYLVLLAVVLLEN